MAYTAGEVARNVADQYTRLYWSAWLSYRDTGDVAEQQAQLAKINSDRADAGLEPLINESEPVVKRCDFCARPLEGTYVDGATKIGPWADMCESCFKQHGVGIGTGMGQRYEVSTGKKLEG